MKLLCWFGHKWKDTSAPVVGRRNLDHLSADGKSMIMEQGPEETFYPDPFGLIKPSRICERCNMRQTNYRGRWG